MASIRRTLSPVPRPGTALNGEACLGGSPLSRSSSYAVAHSPPGGGALSLSSALNSPAFVLSLFSPGNWRLVDKPKQKGQVWRRAIFQFFVCFVVGLLFGLTPFLSTNLYVANHLVSNPHTLSFEAVQPLESVVSKTELSLDSAEDESQVDQHKTELSLDSAKDESQVDQSFIRELDLETKKLLIIVTPTCARPFQAYYLNRLGQTLKLVSSPMVWIVVEMASQSSETADILRKTGVMYRHLICNVNLTDIRGSSVHQRNVALKHIETHQLDGIVYFADDDNVYSSELFDQMRTIRRFGVWKVAKVVDDDKRVEFMLELDGPVCNGTEVIGWHVNNPKLRRRYQRFYADMSGFAFNSTILWDTKRWHRPMLEPIRQIDTVKDDLQASTFIEQIVEDESQMEGLMEGCSRIMAWRNLPLESPASSVYPREWVLKDNLEITASFTP